MIPIEDLLAMNGFALIRDKKHLVYSNGKTNFAMAKTGSDHRQYQNNIRDLKKACLRSGVSFIEAWPKRKKENEGNMGNFSNTPKIITDAPKASTLKPRTLDKEAFEFCFKAREEKKTQLWMTEALEGMGYRKEGGSSYSQSEVSRFLIKNGLRMNVAVKRKPTRSSSAPKYEQPKPSIMTDIQDILTSNLSEQMKEKMILLLVKAGS